MLSDSHTSYYQVCEYFAVLLCLQMVAANIVQSFDEAGLDNADKVAAVGKRQVGGIVAVN